MSTTFSSSESFAQSITRSVTRSERFSITVPPNATYYGKVTVTDFTADVPYDLVFDFGGVQKTVRGIWNGLVVSRSRSSIHPIAHTCPT